MTSVTILVTESDVVVLGTDNTVSTPNLPVSSVTIPITGVVTALLGTNAAISPANLAIISAITPITEVYSASLVLGTGKLISICPRLRSMTGSLIPVL